MRPDSIEEFNKREKDLVENHPRQYKTLSEKYKLLFDEEFVDYLVHRINSAPVWRSNLEDYMKKSKSPFAQKMRLVSRPTMWGKSSARPLLTKLLTDGEASVFSYLHDIARMNDYHNFSQASEADQKKDLKAIEGFIKKGSNPEEFKNIFEPDAFTHFMDEIAKFDDMKLINRYLTSSIPLVTSWASTRQKTGSDGKENQTAGKSAKDHSVKSLDARIRTLEKDLKNEQQSRRKSAKELERLNLQSELDGEMLGKKDLQIKQLREELSEAKRETKRHKDVATSEKKGRERLSAEREMAAQELDAAKKELAACREHIIMLEEETQTAKASLIAERNKRVGLEATLDTFGFESLSSTVKKLDEALNLFGSFREALSVHAEKQDAVRRAELKAQEAKALAEYEAKLEQEQIKKRELAIAQFYEQKLIVFETALLEPTMADRIFIDGHNLIRSAWRPESESGTRKWLEKMIEEMSNRLESTGASTRIELVFDTVSNTNTLPRTHLMNVTFATNDPGVPSQETGADGYIISKLYEVQSGIKIVIFSSDRKHIWAESKIAARDMDFDLECVPIEELAKYVETLQRFLAQ